MQRNHQIYRISRGGIKAAPYNQGEYMAAQTDKRTKNIQYMHDQDREKVHGKFVFYERPGGTLKFGFKKYQNDPVEKYALTDGMEYDLPLAVANHLAGESGRYIVDKLHIGPDGKPSKIVGKLVARYDFVSMEFSIKNAKKDEIQSFMKAVAE